MNRIVKILSFVLIIAICAISCRKDSIVKGNVALTGRWLDIGGYISNGGPQYWIKATGKTYLQLNANGSMTWFKDSDFTKYRVKDSITLKMNNADSTKYEDYYYKIKHDTLIISPRGPVVCIEGCSTYFVKVK